MDIKPIETVYKGYRFRSRLEARWAVFFDTMNIEYRYEAQGFELPSGNYLPDFHLPSMNCFVEVKPDVGTLRDPPRVYMAGRMGSGGHGSHNKLNYRPFDIHDNDLQGSQKTNLVFRSLGKVPVLYCGPYTAGGRDHGLRHGEWHGYDGSVEATTFLRSTDGIRACEIFFAMFEDKEAFGTLVECGYAYALKKRIVAAYISLTDDDEWSSHGGPVDNQLWFSAETASYIIHEKTVELALDRFERWLLAEYPQTREVYLAHELHCSSKESVSIVYGDPVDALQMGGLREFGRPWMEIISDSIECQNACLKARQARFEFGQVPA